jgi:hypothetical protein
MQWRIFRLKWKIFRFLTAPAWAWIWGCAVITHVTIAFGWWPEPEDDDE